MIYIPIFESMKEEEKKFAKVSVFLVSYNHGNFINESINSVLNQTYPNIDITVIDNDSADNSREIIKQYADNGLIKAIFQDNIGLVKTLNNVITSALIKGKYVCFLSCDDYWSTDKIQKQVSIFERANSNLGIVCTDSFAVNSDSKIVKESMNAFYTSHRTDINKDTYGTYKTLIRGNYVLAPTVMFKTTALESVGLYDEKLLVEDYPMWLKMSKKYSFHFINSPLVFYRLHENNITKKKSAQITYELGYTRIKEFSYCIHKGYLMIYTLALASFVKILIKKKFLH